MKIYLNKEDYFEVIEYEICDTGLFFTKEFILGLSVDDFVNIQEYVKENFDNHISEIAEHNEYLKQFHSRKNSKNNKKEKTERWGYIYLIKLKNMNYYKIGKSQLPEDRLNLFEVKFPIDFEIIHKYFISGYDQEENRLHNLFSEKRIKQEWFDLSEEDVEYICSIKGEEE